MKLNKYIVSLLIASSAMSLTTSCGDFLDLKPLGQFTEDDNPGALIEGKVFNVYFLMRGYHITAGIPAFSIHHIRSEDSEKGSEAGDGSNISTMFDDFHYNSAEGVLGDYWGHNFKIIYQCNEIIEAVKAGEKGNLGNSRNAGEAYFFRAYAYFNMVRAFGEVPLITFQVIDPADANVAKSSVAQIYEQIDKDLVEAEKILPLQWDSEYNGRLTWGAARSLHARTYMMRNDWENMYTASKDVIGKGFYNLSTPYDKIFTEDGENNPGSIFELQCTSTASLKADSSIGSQFSEVQGVRGAGKWDFGWGWHMGTRELGKAFEPGDPRRDATLLYFRSTEAEPITAENTNTPYGESPVSPGEGGYFNKKAYTNPATRREFTRGGYWTNIRLIRYSDIVLMAAEAANEKGIPAEAVNYLEWVRAAARGGNMDILPEVTTTEYGALRDAIRHERRVELALEADRFYDLVRWGIAKTVLHTVGKISYEDKHALLPIPQTEIDKAKGVLKQNPDFN